MKMNLRMVSLIVLAQAVLFGAQVNASEVSMVSGLYKSENNKVDGDKTVGISTIEVGARYAEPYQDNYHWFGQGNITLNSYSGDNAPSNSTGLMLRGGMRMYFAQFSETVQPFLSGSGGFKLEKTATSRDETETSGLFYWGDLGLRLEVGQGFFFEVETNLFESALWATSKTKALDDDDPATTEAPDEEQNRMELYVDTRDAFNNTYVSVGMRF